MNPVIILMMSQLLFHYHAQAEVIFKCKSGEQFKYQSDPCDKGTNIQKLQIKDSKPDTASIERLEQQHLDFVKQTDPVAYRRIMREKLSPAERLKDERLEEQERLQQIQTELNLQQQERHQQAVLREMEAQRMQALQLEQERLALERQRILMQQRAIWPQLSYPAPSHSHHKDARAPASLTVLPQPPKRSSPETRDPFHPTMP